VNVYNALTRVKLDARGLALDQELWEREGQVARDEGKTVDELRRRLSSAISRAVRRSESGAKPRSAARG
jgi:hypothetical protein